MSDRSTNGGPRNDTQNAQQGPGHHGDQNNHPGGTNNSRHPNDADITMDSQSRSSDVAASTPYMPQTGNLVGIVRHSPHQHDQRVDPDPGKRRREDVAGSSRWIPQAGKPTGNSSF
ncbi:uncharacterized protein N7496_009495 [Penicillium cataractarum]|uniref:Uncharacterized protein n=1 Tax=Penicillium cataractarum TaxID=2100454 RepID=A0A9W9RPA7_9EURO|nr:uncharacterized protein N7496_009495 [Penicillium cataractarum]KAJ5363782.1 hypothetical protein N7496_009495 [Penicillium cataractarum]